MWPKQAEALDWLSDRYKAQEPGAWEKSRDGGASYIIAGFQLYHWRFTSGFAGILGSRKTDLVDRKGDPKTLFWKLRYMLGMLPRWFWPEGFDPGVHDNYLNLQNPANDSTITGEGGDQMGRGARATLYAVDEHAQVARAESVDSAISGAANCVIYVSSAYGAGNLFYRKVHDGKIPVFRLHWTDDPRKDEAWAERQKERWGPVIFAAEYDIDYAASIEGVIIPAKWVQAAIDLKLPTPKGGWSVKTAGLDVADEGDAENVYALRNGPKIARLESWSQTDTTQTAHRAARLGRKDKIQYLRFDSIGVGAGVSGTLKGTEKPYPFKVVPVNVGKPPTSTRYQDAPDIPAPERFLNLKAELWWALRLRFLRTYEHVHGIDKHPIDDLISIPNDSELIRQLSAPLHSVTETGKIRIESKVDLRRRSVKSPDRAEAVILAFADVTVRKLRIGRA